MQASHILETELEWLIYQLWSKTTARAPTFSFKLAETVILRDGCPQTWYFSSKQGYILRKNQSNVKLSKINKRFLLKNGMQVRCQDDMPVAQSYLYRAQRNMETGAERLAIRTGYHAGQDFMKKMRVWSVVEQDRPQILQMFYTHKQSKTSVLKVQWTLSQLQMTKFTNNLPLFDQQYCLTKRTVTVEDAEDSFYTQPTILLNQGLIYERILTAMLEIHNHIKKNADINLTAGTFYFKGEETEKPTLLFATNLKTDRPILVLNPSIHVALVLQESHEAQGGREVQITPASEAISRLHERRSTSQNQIRSGGDDDSDINMMNQLNDFQTNEDKQSLGTHSGSAFANPASRTLKFQIAQELHKIMAKRPMSGQQSSINFDACVFCLEPNGKGKLPFELTANQVIKLYDYYIENPSGLLLLPATSEKQQKLFEEIYQQLTQAGEQDEESLEMVPMPLQRAFDITSFAKYQMAKHDMDFIYRTLRICPPCYNAIKMMLVHQMNEQQAVIMEGTVATDSLGPTMKSSNGATKLQAVVGMFSKVEAGREVSSSTIAQAQTQEEFEKSVRVKGASGEIKKPVAPRIGAVSLEVGGTKSGKQLNLKRYRTTTNVDFQKETNKQIMTFLKRNSMDAKPSNALKNMARARVSSNSTKGRITFTKSIPLHEKNKLREARRNVRRQKDAVLELDQQPPSVAYQTARTMQNVTSPMGAGKVFQNVAAKSTYGTRPIRPISAKSISFNNAIIQDNRLMSENQSHQIMSLQPVASSNHMQQQPSTTTLSTNFAPNGIYEGVNGLGQKCHYSNLDACKVYLQSLNQRDFHTLVTQDSKKLHQKFSTHRLSRRPMSGLPPKNRDKSNSRKPRVLQDHYNWKRPTLYPASRIMSGSPSESREGKVGRKHRRFVHGPDESVNMFNYQSNTSVVNNNQPTNLLVPQNAAEIMGFGPDGGLAASLLKIQDMKMSEDGELEMRNIDQIAANADNLIEILQSIKNFPTRANAPSDKRSSMQQSDAVNILPAQIDESSLAEKQKDEYVKQVDFWDSHTHSPPVQIRSMPAAEEQEDFWGNNQPIRAVQEQEIVSSSQHVQEVSGQCTEPVRISNERQKKKTSSKQVSNVGLNKSVADSKASKSKQLKQKKSQIGKGSPAGAGRNSDLMVELNSNLSQSIPKPQVVQANIININNQIQTVRREENKSPPKTQIEVYLQAPSSQRSNEVSSHQTQPYSHLSANMKPNNDKESIPEPLIRPSPIMNKIKSKLQKRVQKELKDPVSSNGFVVYGDNPRMGSSNASSMPEMMKSEAFDSAVRPKAVPENSEFDLTRMEIPQLSPMALDANPNVQAQVYAVVDNRFLESSAGSDLPLAYANDSYSQDFSSAQKGFKPTHQVISSIDELASPSAHQVASESLIIAPTEESPETKNILIHETNVFSHEYSLTAQKNQLYTNKKEVQSNSVMPQTEMKAQEARLVHEDEPAVSVELTYDATFDEPTFADDGLTDQVEWKINFDRTDFNAADAINAAMQSSQPENIVPEFAQTIKAAQEPMLQEEKKNPEVVRQSGITQQETAMPHDFPVLPLTQQLSNYSNSFVQTIKSKNCFPDAMNIEESGALDQSLSPPRSSVEKFDRQDKEQQSEDSDYKFF